MSGRKSPQKRPIWCRLKIVRFAETGWWGVQSYANRSRKTQNRITGKNTGKNANICANWRSDSQRPSIHRSFWAKTTKTLSGKKISRTGKLRKITGKKYSIGVSVHFSHTCFFAVRTRSVLTEKFSGGGPDVVSSRALRRGFLAGAPRGLASK